MPRITVTSVPVADQDAALRFYTDTLGFVERRSIPLGADRWLTVVSADDPEGTELLLEPNGHPVAATYQRGLYEAGIPAATFQVDDIDAEIARLRDLGVRIAVEPMDVPGSRTAIIDDTCGNLIALHTVTA